MNTIVMANFTADGFLEPFKQLLQRVGYCENPVLLPPYQIIQHLIDPRLCVSASADTCVLLLDLNRWVEGAANDQDAASSIEDLVLAIEQAIQSWKLRHFFFVSCPAREYSQFIRGAEVTLGTLLMSIQHIDYLSREDVLKCNQQLDPEDYFDASLNRLADIPFTRYGFAGMALAVVRLIHAKRRIPTKAIILDCDNTLWRGQCGEVAAEALEITDEHRDLHRLLADQRRYGRILCVCSKNNEVDVRNVFRYNSRMALHAGDITLWEVNWKDKPDNVLRLCRTLGITVESVIFIDDDQFECELMEARLPGVTTIRLPVDPRTWPEYLSSVWELDLPATMAVPVNRAEFYEIDEKRVRLRSSLSTVEEFIRTLQLQTSFELISPETVPRAAEITYRTNQFNLNGSRFSELELERLSKVFACEAIAAQDRYGDYGVVGLLVSNCVDYVLIVHNLYLSCRTLGRGIEGAIWSELELRASRGRMRAVRFLFRPTSRNDPVKAFLGCIGAKVDEHGAEVTIEAGSQSNAK
jgi:FkbH-like protein